VRGRGDQLVADADFACARLDEAGDQPQRGGLAAAGRPQQADQVAVLDMQRHIIDHRDIAVSLGQAPQLNRRHAHSPRYRAACRSFRYPALIASTPQAPFPSTLR
jgi:hypothetical protein